MIARVATGPSGLPGVTSRSKVRNWPGRNSGRACPSTGCRSNEHCDPAASSWWRDVTRNSRVPGHAEVLAGFADGIAASPASVIDRDRRRIATPTPTAACNSKTARIQARS